MVSTRRAADHELREVALVRLGRDDLTGDGSRPHDRDAIADRHHLAQFVADEHDRLAVVGHRTHRGEQRVDLGWREHGGRFVEQQDVGAAIQHLDDSTLALPDVRLEINARGPIGSPNRSRSRRPLLDIALTRIRDCGIAKHDVLGDGEAVDQPEVLVHLTMPLASPSRGLRRSIGVPFSVSM